MLRQQIIATIGRQLPDGPERVTASNRARLAELGLNWSAFRRLRLGRSHGAIRTYGPVLDRLGYRLHDSDGNVVESRKEADR